MASPFDAERNRPEHRPRAYAYCLYPHADAPAPEREIWAPLQTPAHDAAGCRHGVPWINGFGHIDLTVTDVDRSVRWWEEVMGFKLISTRDRPDFKLWSVIHPCGFFIGLMSHSNPASDRFDERAVGSITSRCGSLTERRSKRGRSISTTSASSTQACRRSRRGPSRVSRPRQHPA